MYGTSEIEHQKHGLGKNCQSFDVDGKMVNYRFNSLALDAVDFSKAANGAIKV
jgi:hypothetical protein